MTRILRRFNYTQRVNIPASKVQIDVVEGEDGRCRGLLRRLDLSDRGRHLEAEWKAARVVIEARRLSTASYCKHDLGSVAEVEKSGAAAAFELKEFADGADIRFRVKVVDGSKKLLGECDNIKSGEEEEAAREPLITLVATELGEELWKVDWVEFDGPRVLVNKRLPNCSGLLTRDPLISGLVMPQIVREVITQVAAAEEGAEPWVEKWVCFAEGLGQELPDDADDDARVKWIDDVVGAYADNLRLATRAETHLLRTLEET
jgi:hypothetical protein